MKPKLKRTEEVSSCAFGVSSTTLICVWSSGVTQETARFAARSCCYRATWEKNPKQNTSHRVRCRCVVVAHVGGFLCSLQGAYVAVRTRSVNVYYAGEGESNTYKTHTIPPVASLSLPQKNLLRSLTLTHRRHGYRGTFRVKCLAQGHVDEGGD